MVAILFPETDFRAIEERYASWQCELILRRAMPRASVVRVPREKPAAAVAAAIRDEATLVVTNPLILPPHEILKHLQEALNSDAGAAAALPVTNLSTATAQHDPPAEIYLTLRQLEQVAAQYAARTDASKSVTWGDDDPTLFLARTSHLRSSQRPLREVLTGSRVAITPRVYVHRFAAHRSQLRLDVLERIDRTAKSVLEFGCGEGGLGEALKQRQQCRVVGVELDPDAARIARTRLDAVFEGDVRQIVTSLDEQFDFIVGGDVLEHLDEPWTFLEMLRRVAKPGAHVLLSLPNVSCWPIVADLLQGRFDYVYMGILCAGHVRFYTKQTVRDLLEIAGWTEVSLSDQEHFTGPEYEKLQHALAAGGVKYSPSDLLPTGHYVLARNDAVS